MLEGRKRRLMLKKHITLHAFTTTGLLQDIGNMTNALKVERIVVIVRLTALAQHIDLRSSLDV